MTKTCAEDSVNRCRIGCHRRGRAHDRPASQKGTTETFVNKSPGGVHVDGCQRVVKQHQLTNVSAGFRHGLSPHVPGHGSIWREQGLVQAMSEIGRAREVSEDLPMRIFWPPDKLTPRSPISVRSPWSNTARS